MNFHINQVNSKMESKLRNLKSKNPKEFWKIIKNIDRSKTEQKINLEPVYQFFLFCFFLNLNENSDHADDDNEVNIEF